MDTASIDNDYLRWVEVSRSAIHNNISVLRGRVGDDRKMMAVVKANAYGHGVTLVSPEYLAAGVDCLGVATFEEAAELRESGYAGPLYVIAAIARSKIFDVVRLNLHPVVFDLDFVKALDIESRKSGERVEISVKIETGMKRHGVREKNLDQIMDYIEESDNLVVTGFSTHFASSDSDDPKPTENQFYVIKSEIERYRNLGYDLPLCHAANSAAAIAKPDTHLEMVRCGISIYGLYPSVALRDMLRETPLRQVLEFKTRVVQVQALETGDRVSYGGTWVARRPSRIAVLPVGYADGYNRLLSNKGHVLIRGRKAPIAGRVCMNVFMVDVTEIEGAAVGDEVTLISRDEDSGISCYDLSVALGTIEHEVLTSIDIRIPRIMVD